MRALSPRDRRALGWGISAIVGAVLLFRSAPAAVRAVLALRERAAAQAVTLARANDLLAREPAARDSLSATLRAIVALAPDLVDGQSSADAQASLGGVVSLVADRHAVKVLRLDPLPDSSSGVFHQVAVHAELEGDLTGVTQVLAVLEKGEPALSVTALAIDSPDPTPHPRSPEALHVALDVVGYYMPGRGK